MSGGLTGAVVHPDNRKSIDESVMMNGFNLVSMRFKFVLKAVG